MTKKNLIKNSKFTDIALMDLYQNPKMCLLNLILNAFKTKATDGNYRNSNPSPVSH